MGNLNKLNREFIQRNYSTNYHKVNEIIKAENISVPLAIKKKWTRMFSSWEMKNVFSLERGWEEWRETVYWFDWDEILEYFLFKMLKQEYSYKAEFPTYDETSVKVLDEIVITKILQ